MSLLTPTQFNMYWISGHRPLNRTEEAQALFSETPQSVENDKKLTHRELWKVLLARQQLSEISGVDFGFRPKTWHNYLLTAPDGGFGYQQGLADSGQPCLRIRELMDTPYARRTSRAAGLLWNCLSRKEVLTDFLSKYTSS